MQKYGLFWVYAGGVIVNRPYTTYGFATLVSYRGIPVVNTYVILSYKICADTLT